MGYAICFGPCLSCGNMFGYNPVRVPSLTWKGNKEPICKSCIDRINPRRIANGLDPIVPHPEAYEPCNENELP
jgi:hypothetical protein